MSKEIKTYFSETMLKDKPKKKLGLIINDGAVTTRKLANEAVTEEKLAENSVSTDKIKDHNVTWDKLTPEAQKVIEAGTGVDSDLVHDMEQWNNRIAALESKNLQLNTVIEFYFQDLFQNTDVVEYIPNVSINITIQLRDANGIISEDANYTNKHLYYTINENDADEADVQDDHVKVKYKYDSPGRVNIEAWGTAAYKGVFIKFPVVHKTFYAVLPSYIGYIEDYNNWNNTGTKLVKHSLNGQYNVVNPFDLAYLVIAIPKNGMVSNISSIIQKGTLDAVQQYSVIDKGNYTLYVCNTKHNKGTYTFAIS